MKSYNLLSVIPPVEGETYDSTLPTKQTELLCLSLRRVLTDMAGVPENIGLTVSQAEGSDYSDAITAIESVGTDVEGFFAAFENSEVPAIPDLGSWATIIASILPAILSGGVSLSALVPILLPKIIEGLLTLLKNRIENPVGDVSEALYDMSDTLDGIGKANHYTHNNQIFNTPDALMFALTRFSGEPGLASPLMQDVIDKIDALTVETNDIKLLIEELEQAGAVAVMNTSEVDKIIYVKS